MTKNAYTSKAGTYRRLRKPKRYAYEIKVPHGYRVAAQKFCERVFGQPYEIYYKYTHNGWQGHYRVYAAARWFYRDGSIWFTEPVDESLLTMVYLSKPRKKR